MPAHSRAGIHGIARSASRPANSVFVSEEMRTLTLIVFGCMLHGVLTASLAVALDPKTETNSAQLQLTLSTANSAYRAGEAADMTFTLTNVSDQPLMLVSFGPALFGFAVYDASGNLVAKPTLPQKPIMGPRSMTAAPRGTLLQAGKSITGKLTWELVKTNSSGDRIPLASGAYALIGYAWWDRDGAPRLRTPPLLLRIVAASS